MENIFIVLIAFVWLCWFAALLYLLFMIWKDEH